MPKLGKSGALCARLAALCMAEPSEVKRSQNRGYEKGQIGESRPIVAMLLEHCSILSVWNGRSVKQISACVLKQGYQVEL